MKKNTIAMLFLSFALTVVPAFAQQAGPELVEEAVNAYNNQDLAYFERHLAEDVVWMDEDGHAMSGKTTVLSFMRIQLNASPSRTLSISNVQVGSTSDAAWATFAYTLEGGDEPVAGLNTTVFRRTANDWEVVVVHGARNSEGHH